MDRERQIIECRGYKAYIEIDFDKAMIIGNVYNLPCPDHRIEFSAESIEDLCVEFEGAISDYYDACRKKHRSIPANAGQFAAYCI